MLQVGAPSSWGDYAPPLGIRQHNSKPDVLLLQAAAFLAFGRVVFLRLSIARPHGLPHRHDALHCPMCAPECTIVHSGLYDRTLRTVQRTGGVSGCTGTSVQRTVPSAQVDTPPRTLDTAPRTLDTRHHPSGHSAPSIACVAPRASLVPRCVRELAAFVRPRPARTGTHFGPCGVRARSPHSRVPDAAVHDLRRHP
jgi:hypothetical protein